MNKYRVFEGVEWDQEVWDGGFWEGESEEMLDDDALYVLRIRKDGDPKFVASLLRDLANEIENPGFSAAAFGRASDEGMRPSKRNIHLQEPKGNNFTLGCLPNTARGTRTRDTGKTRS